MPRPTQYAKGIAKRAEILELALQLIGEHGYDRTTIPELAKAAGLSQPGLIHHFGNKEQLYVEILRKRDEVSAASAATSFAEIAADNARVPGLIELYSHVMVDAAAPGHDGHEFVRDRYELARSAIADRIRVLQAEGTVSPDLDADKVAAIGFAMFDGIQLQWMHDPSIDIPAHVDYFWRTLIGVDDLWKTSPAQGLRDVAAHERSTQ